MSVKPTIENSPLPMAGKPALQDSTIMVKSSISTNKKPAMDTYSSCTRTKCKVNELKLWAFNHTMTI